MAALEEAASDYGTDPGGRRQHRQDERDRSVPRQCRAQVRLRVTNERNMNIEDSPSSARLAAAKKEFVFWQTVDWSSRFDRNSACSSSF